MSAIGALQAAAGNAIILYVYLFRERAELGGLFDGWNPASVRLSGVRARGGGRAVPAAQRTDPRVAGAGAGHDADDVAARAVCVLDDVQPDRAAVRPGRRGAVRGRVRVGRAQGAALGQAVLRRNARVAAGRAGRAARAAVGLFAVHACASRGGRRAARRPVDLRRHQPAPEHHHQLAERILPARLRDPLRRAPGVSVLRRQPVDVDAAVRHRACAEPRDSRHADDVAGLLRVCDLRVGADAEAGGGRAGLCADVHQRRPRLSVHV